MRTSYIRRDRTELRILMVPGLRGSGPLHWQTLWQEEHPDYERVVQPDWMNPDLERWAHTVAEHIDQHSGPVLLAAHSFGCLAAVRARALRRERIAGALLVAPPDPRTFAAGHRLAQVTLDPAWIVVASRNDPWLAFPEARAWASRWSCGFVDAGQAGHINAEAGYGEWQAGERLLAQLRARVSCEPLAAVRSLAA
jgi:predicted alpha/beta hydrolase family esterase